MLILLVPAIHCLGRQPATAPQTLKNAWGKYFDVGAAIPSSGLNPGEEQLLESNFNTITPENCMKPGPVEPEEGRFTFKRADELVALAQRNGLKINGHTLVWHNQCPEWFFIDGGLPAGRGLVLQRMRNHITTEVARYKGKITSWDVVNEAISDQPGEYLRKSKWLNSIGEDFIAQAFVSAHAADPDARLFLNDYGIERPEKREKALRLIRELQKQHVTIDGIGIQGHWSLDHVPYADIEDSIAAFHALGLKVAISELDLDVVPRSAAGADVTQTEKVLNDPYINGCPNAVLNEQAGQYARLFAIFKKHSGQISRVTFWGLHDGLSWLNIWPQKRTNFPLLFARDLQSKPAFAAVMEQAEK